MDKSSFFKFFRNFFTLGQTKNIALGENMESNQSADPCKQEESDGDQRSPGEICIAGTCLAGGQQIEEEFIRTPGNQGSRQRRSHWFPENISPGNFNFGLSEQRVEIAADDIGIADQGTDRCTHNIDARNTDQNIVADDL